MRKYIVFYFSLFVLHSYSLSPPSLSENIFDVFFDHKTWALNKKIVQQGLKEYKYPGDLFKDKTIIGLDFSGLDLSGKDFSDSKLVKVNLSGTDLTNTTFHHTHFDRCNLVGAYFRYPLDGSEKVFTISSNDDYELVKQYSDLMDQKEEKEKEGLEKEATDLAHQAGCLNHLFQALRLNLENKDLRNFNLIDINLQYGSLFCSDLQEARLSKNFTIPNRKNWDELFDDFKEAVNYNTPEKEVYLKLLKNQAFMFYSHNMLQEVDWKGLDLTHAFLFSSRLQKSNLEDVDFTEANLESAHLNNSNLTGVTFKNTNLCEAKLKGAWFSKDFQLNYDNLSDVFEKWYEANMNDHPDKKYYNLLATNRFDMFRYISREHLVNTLKNKLDVRNAFLFCSKLNEVKLDGIDFEKANVAGSKFNQSTLSNICFRNGNVSDSNFSDASLKKVNFNLANLNRAYFKKAILESVSFKGADLTESDFRRAKLKDVDFFAADISGLKLSDKAMLPKSDNDQDHINFYHQCQDLKAKALLKIILESRDITLEP